MAEITPSSTYEFTDVVNRIGNHSFPSRLITANVLARSALFDHPLRTVLSSAPAQTSGSFSDFQSRVTVEFAGAPVPPPPPPVVAKTTVPHLVVRSTEPGCYLDNISPSEVSYETNPANLTSDLNNLRSVANNILNRDGASFPVANWYDDISAPAVFTNDTGHTAAVRGLNALGNDLWSIQRQRLLKRVAMVGVDVAPGVGAQHVFLGTSQLPSLLTAAVGAVETPGTVVAAVGDLGVGAQLSIVDGANALEPKNLLVLTNGATREAVQGVISQKQVYGLLQSRNPADGHTIGTSSSPDDRVQISFVVHNATNDGLELAPAGDMDGVVFDYAFVRRDAFEDCPEEAWLSDGFTDTGAGNVLLQVAYDTQGATAVSTISDANLNLGTGFSWVIKDDDSAVLFSVDEGSAGSASKVRIEADVDDFVSAAATNTMVKGSDFGGGSRTDGTVHLHTDAYSQELRFAAGAGNEAKVTTDGTLCLNATENLNLKSSTDAVLNASTSIDIGNDGSGSEISIASDNTARNVRIATGNDHTVTVGSASSPGDFTLHGLTTEIVSYSDGGLRASGTGDLMLSTDRGSEDDPGSLNLSAGTGLVTGGSVNVSGGSGTTTGDGGCVMIAAGSAGTDSGTGGDLCLEAGASINGTKGDMYVGSQAVKNMYVGCDSTGTAVSESISVGSKGLVGVAAQGGLFLRSDASNSGSGELRLIAGTGSAAKGNSISLQPGAGATTGGDLAISLPNSPSGAGTVAITQNAASPDAALVSYSNGAAGAEMYVGSSAPAHSANGGSLYMRNQDATGAGGEAHINRGTSVAPDWKPIMTLSSATTSEARQMIQVCLTADVTGSATEDVASTNVTVSNVAGGSLLSRDASLDFATQAEIYLNGVLMANGVGADVAAATLGDDTMDLWIQPGMSLESGDVVTIVYHNM